VGPRAVLDAVVKRKIPSPRWESNPRTPIVQPIAQRYTDWAITALIRLETLRKHTQSLSPASELRIEPVTSRFRNWSANHLRSNDGKHKKCMQDFSRKTRRGHMGNFGLYGMIVIKSVLKKLGVGCGWVDWIQLTPDRVQQWALLNRVINLPIPQKVENFLTTWLSSSQEWLCCMELLSITVIHITKMSVFISVHEYFLDQRCTWIHITASFVIRGLRCIFQIMNEESHIFFVLLFQNSIFQSCDYSVQQVGVTYLLQLTARNSNKVKIKLSLCFNWAPRHEGVLGEWRYSSTRWLTSELNGSGWLASLPGRFIPRKRAPGTHWIGWVGPIAVLDAVVKRKIPSPGLESNPRTLIVQPVAQSCTDWAVTALSKEQWPV
jgi:hypothetical protein